MRFILVLRQRHFLMREPTASEDSHAFVIFGLHISQSFIFHKSSAAFHNIHALSLPLLVFDPSYTDLCLDTSIKLLLRVNVTLGPFLLPSFKSEYRLRL